MKAFKSSVLSSQPIKAEIEEAHSTDTLDEGCGELVCLSCWGSFSLYRLVGSRLCSEGDFFYCTSNPLSLFQDLPVSFLDKFGIRFRFGPFCVALAMKLITSTFCKFFLYKGVQFFCKLFLIYGHLDTSLRHVPSGP